MLDEATVRYGDLETKYNKKVESFGEEIAKRDECIQHLKKELNDANELLEAAKRGRFEFFLQFFLDQFFHYTYIIQSHGIPFIDGAKYLPVKL